MHTKFRWMLAAIFLLMFQQSAVIGEDHWPQWRGANRDGRWQDADIAETFPAEGLKVRWKAPAGWGFSSPVVAQGRVYLADSELDYPKAHERMRCWNEVSGELLWTHTYEVTYEDWAFDPAQEIGPVATPLVQDGKVYLVGRVGHLFCLDAAAGTVLWQKDLVKEYQVEFAPGAPSPLVEGGLLILFIGGKPDACVVAFNQDTGEERWKALDESMTFSSPIVISSGGKRQLIVWTKESVTSLDPQSGTPYWRQKLLTNSDYAVSTPVFFQDRLLIGGLMLQLDSNQPAAKVLWPASTAPARRIYSHTSTAMFEGEVLFSARSTGELIGVNANTGEQIWEATTVTDLKNGASIHLTPIKDSVLLYTNKGDLIRAKLTVQGYQELSRVHVQDPTFPWSGGTVCWSPPAYANGHIFVRNGKELICAALTDRP